VKGEAMDGQSPREMSDGDPHRWAGVPTQPRRGQGGHARPPSRPCREHIMRGLPIIIVHLRVSRAALVPLSSHSIARWHR
jgi:hypothetical protein